MNTVRILNAMGVTTQELKSKFIQNVGNCPRCWVARHSGAKFEPEQGAIHENWKRTLRQLGIPTSLSMLDSVQREWQYEATCTASTVLKEVESLEKQKAEIYNSAWRKIVERRTAEHYRLIG